MDKNENKDLDLDLDLDFDFDEDIDLEEGASSESDDLDLELDDNLDLELDDDEESLDLDDDLDLELDNDEESLDLDDDLDLELDDDESLDLNDDIDLELDDDLDLDEEESLELGDDLDLELEDDNDNEKSSDLVDELKFEGDESDLESELLEDDVFNELDELSEEELAELENVSKDDEIDLDIDDEDIEDINLSEENNEDEVMYKEDVMSDEDLRVDDDQLDSVQNKKSNKLVYGILAIGSLITLGGGGYWFYQNNTLQSDMSYDDEIPDVSKQVNVNNEKLLKEVEILSKKLNTMENDYQTIKKDNATLKSQRDKEMADFDIKLRNLGKQQSSVSNANDINEIVKIAEQNVMNKLGSKFKDYDEKLNEVSKGIERNSEYIKKTFKISATALKKAQEIEKSQADNIKMMKAQSDMLQDLSSKIGTSEVKVTPELLNKLDSIEKEIEVMKNNKVETKRKVTVPIEVEIKESSIQNNTKKAPQKAIVNKIYSVVGVFGDNTVYLKDTDSGIINSYVVGQDLDGYGEILSISKDGLVKTENGLIKDK